MPPTPRERLIVAANAELGEDTVAGLLEQELDYEDLVMAVCAELFSIGFVDPEIWLQEHHIR